MKTLFTLVTAAALSTYPIHSDATSCRLNLNKCFNAVAKTKPKTIVRPIPLPPRTQAQLGATGVKPFAGNRMNLVYQPHVQKHGTKPRQFVKGVASREPKRGAWALQRSIPVSPTSTQRIAVDKQNSEYVVFKVGDKNGGVNSNTYHGYAVEYKDLPTPHSNALLYGGFINSNGKIL